MRVFKHATLGRVAVYEQDSKRGRVGDSILVFEWAFGARRLESFPADWPSMNETQLVALSGFEKSRPMA